MDRIDVVLQSFRAVERRDRQGLLELEHADVEFQWPPSLPYGGTARRDESRSHPTEGRWTATWDPLQPTEAERRMDPRVVAANEDEVVVLWHQRAIDAAGNRLDEPVLGLYQVREGKLARAQMFYFDPVAVGEYLARAKRVADETLNERNAASRARIRAIGGHVSDEALSRPFEGPWTAGALFAHIAFWDRLVLERWSRCRETGRGVPEGLDEAMFDLVNDAALPQWVLVPPREAVEECQSASDELDAYIGSLDEGSISEVVAAGRIRLVDRSLHRNEHLDALDAALLSDSS